MLIIPIITILTSVLITLAVIFREHQKLPNIVFSFSLLSIAAVVLGDSIILNSPDLLVKWKKGIFITEVVMVSSWLLFAVSFARNNNWGTINKFARLLVCFAPLLVLFILIIPIDDFFYSPEFESEKMLFLGNAGYTLNIFLLFYSVMSIINLEATLRNSSGRERWQVKFILIGAGGILATNILYYSNALLYRSINMNLVPVRSVTVLISILIIGIFLFKRRAMDVEIHIARRTLYRSVSIFIVGFYLLGLGVVSEGMRYFGPQAGRNITMLIGFAGAMGVLAVLFSEQLRRKTVVFINKNFYSQKYDYREQWQQFTQRISLKHSFDELLASILEGMKNPVNSRGASIWFKEIGNNNFMCVRSIDPLETNAKPSKELIEFLKEKKWVVDTHDLKCKEVIVNSVEFIKKTRASLIVPLLHIDELIGFIVLEEGIDSYDYNYEDFDLLKTLARQATAVILNARLSEDLMEAKEMEAVGRLSSFIMHDLKNSAAMLSLVTQNAEMHIDKPEFQRDAFKTIANTSEKMKGIIEKLKNLPHKMDLKMQYNDLGQYVKSTVTEMELNGKSNVSFQELKPVKTKFDGDEITKVIINLVLNAFEAIEQQGQIKIVVGLDSDMGYVKVSDNGCGMSKEFIEKNLFRPFQTTKKNGLGIGLYQCKTIIEAHAGVFKVDSKEGRGTDFTFYLPLLSD